MRQYLIILLAFTFFACNTKKENKQAEMHQAPFQETGLEIACTRAIKTLDNEIHGVCYIDNNGNHIDNDSINKLLYSISLLDDFTQSNSKKYTSEQFELFEKTDKEVKAYKLITTRFLIENLGHLNIVHFKKTQIDLQDFDLYLNDIKKRITMRVLNEYEVLKLKIGPIEFYRLLEDVPIGLEEAIFKLDSIKEKQKMFN